MSVSDFRTMVRWSSDAFLAFAWMHAAVEVLKCVQEEHVLEFGVFCRIEAWLLVEIRITGSLGIGSIGSSCWFVAAYKA